MAYRTDADIGSGRVTVPTVRQNNARFTGQPAPQIPDEDDSWSRQVYTKHVYGGPVSNQPEVQQAIAKQYDYNKMRVHAGKQPLKIADVRWDPTAYDDGMNEWMSLRYEKTGKLPSGEERLDHYQEEAAKKWRETFETAAEPAEYHPIASGLSALKESVEPLTAQASQINQNQQEQHSRHSVMDPMSIAGGMSQLAGNGTSGQPTAYEQAKALGMQTAPTRTSDMVAAKGQGPSGTSGTLGIWESLLNPYAENANPTVKTLKQIDDAVVKYNPSALAADWLIVRPLAAVKSLYLNAVAAPILSASGKEVTFTPDMTYAQYTAKISNATGSPDYLQQSKDYLAGDAYKQALAHALNVPPDSDVVNGLSGAAVKLLTDTSEAAADPASYIGIGEGMALSRGSRALKAGDESYEAALQANKANGGLKPIGESTALQNEKARARFGALQREQAKRAQLADEAAQGYTQNGSRAADKMLQDGTASLQQGAEGTRRIFAQGAKIPDDLLKTKPSNSPAVNKWLDGGGKIEIENGTWKYTNSQGVSVHYKNGHPDFKSSGHVVQEVDIGPFRERSTDFKLADQLATNGPKNPRNTWHHHEDGRTLQEVNRRTHEMFTHKGGIAIVKRGRK